MGVFKKFFITVPDAESPAQVQRTLNTFQQNVDDAFNELNKVSILNNTTIENIVVNTTATVSHKLKRKPQGYIIISRSANAQVWNDSPTDTTLVLRSSTNVTVSILVF